jgi:hypothetical protein
MRMLLRRNPEPLPKRGKLGDMVQARYLKLEEHIIRLYMLPKQQTSEPMAFTTINKQHVLKKQTATLKKKFQQFF